MTTTVASARKANIVVAAALLVALPLLTDHTMPHLLTGSWWLQLCVACSFALAAISLNVLLGYAGQLSLGHAAMLGVGAFTAGLIATNADLPMPAGLACAVVTGGLVALPVGLPALRLRGLYLAIVTVVFGIAVEYNLFNSSLLSSGSAGVALNRRIWGSHSLTDNASFLVVCLLLLLVVWVVDANLLRTRIGRAFRTIRENEDVAASLGVNVTRYKLLAFVISGSMAGLAGAVYGYANYHVDATNFDVMQSLFIVVIVVVGGLGRRAAVVVSAFAFELLPRVLHLPAAWAPVIGAGLLMATVAGHPDGIGDLLAVRRRAPAAEEDADDELSMPPLPRLPLPAGAEVAPVSGDLLEVSNVSVRFGGLQAVDGVSLTVPAGQIVGLIGPNGAGKSTLFNAISGLTRTQGGVIRFRGQEIQQLRCDQRARLGIARSFQQVGLAKDLTVRENVLLAQHQLTSYSDFEAIFGLPRAAHGESELAARASAVIEGLGLQTHADMPLRNLSGGQQRIVEIGCLLATAPSLVLLDEPSAGMSPAATESLAQRLRDLRDELGRTVLLIEHNVPLVLDTCDYVYVLDAGKLIAAGVPSEITRRPEVVDAYFGFRAEAVPV